MKVLALLCLVAMAAGLVFSQQARELVVGMSGSPALRHFFTGRKLIKTKLSNVTAIRFEDYDGFTNTSEHLREHAWLARGFVEYDVNGKRRRDHWACAFDAQKSEVILTDLNVTAQPTPDFAERIKGIREGRRGIAVPSTAGSITEAWGWKKP